MGRPYSADLRERVQADIEAGQSRRSASRRFGVSPSFAVKLVRWVRGSGSTAPARQDRPPDVTSERHQRLRARVPFGHWHTQTVIAARRCDGLTAPWIIDGPMTR